MQVRITQFSASSSSSSPNARYRKKLLSNKHARVRHYLFLFLFCAFRKQKSQSDRRTWCLALCSRAGVTIAHRRISFYLLRSGTFPYIFVLHEKCGPIAAHNTPKSGILCINLVVNACARACSPNTDAAWLSLPSVSV